ncbi:hypothetical protein K435DRAFT_857295 [Dendrothele bispora CBS 962.96]|uniref:MIF4G-like type 1 domain-containing protein n=1 Tax=Dendrothele bispora (strain CBS 962.96) TaxID=1314807 RepID=A0A4V4HG76_DENBC|nr:hypothetical protein K435DRAFT_857295 [Dendrothele bispora CBS 962.96]
MSFKLALTSRRPTDLALRCSVLAKFTSFRCAWTPSLGFAAGILLRRHDDDEHPPLMPISLIPNPKPKSKPMPVEMDSKLSDSHSVVQVIQDALDLLPTEDWLADHRKHHQLILCLAPLGSRWLILEEDEGFDIIPGTIRLRFQSGVFVWDDARPDGTIPYGSLITDNATTIGGTFQLRGVPSTNDHTLFYTSLMTSALGMLPTIDIIRLIPVTEQPYKIPYYTALLRRLHDTPEDGNPEELSLGRQILEEFWKGFQAYMDKLAWRETRFCIHFFSHLTPAKLVGPESLTLLLQAFTTVLDEFEVSHGRAEHAALCAAEGLMIGDASLKAISPLSPSEIINALQTFIETTTNAKWVVQPTLKLHSSSVDVENADGLLDNALAVLKALDSVDFDAPCPRPYSEYPELNSVFFTPFTLPLEEESDAQVRREEWPEYFLRIFPDDISPDPNTPAGYTVRADLLAMVDIFEVNRKECARLLLGYLKWTLPGTFKPKPGAPLPEVELVVAHDWQLESTILETVLSALLLLPESSQKQVYYISKLSPQTVGSSTPTNGSPEAKVDILRASLTVA